MEGFSFQIVDKTDNEVKFNIFQKGGKLDFKSVFELWAVDSEFVKFYWESLLDISFTAFYWEHPAITNESLSKPYECSIIKSTPLETLSANESAFKDYLYKQEPIHDFENLGKDARLVVPSKKSNQEIYSHFGKFLRHAEYEQVLALFNRIGSVIMPEIANKQCVWLNTAGLGVIWLHVRMDTKPKYYKSQDYKDPHYLRLTKHE